MRCLQRSASTVNAAHDTVFNNIENHLLGWLGGAVQTKGVDGKTETYMGRIFWLETGYRVTSTVPSQNSTSCLMKRGAQSLLFVCEEYLGGKSVIAHAKYRTMVFENKHVMR